MTEHRISNAERETAAARLGDFYAEGRLDDDEYFERLDAVWTARTTGDLAILFHDLPLAPQPSAGVPLFGAPGGPPGRRAGGPLRRLPWWARALVVLAAVLFVVHNPVVTLVLLVLAFMLLQRRWHRRHGWHDHGSYGGGGRWPHSPYTR